MSSSKLSPMKLTKLATQEKIYGFIFIAPVVLGFITFILVPLIVSLSMSFTNWSLFGGASFVGLENFQNILLKDKIFWKVLNNTFNFSMGLVSLNLILAFSLALLLKQKISGISFFRTAIFTPVVTSIVVWSIVWKFIFATEGGLINMVLKFIGIQGPAWLFDLKLVMPVVIVVSVLKNVGNNMVIFLASLYNVPEMYYEAATLDGASPWQKMKHITLPMITPTIFMLMIMTMIGSLKVFGQIYVMTGGGPANSTAVLVYYIYHQAFKLYEFGYASAVAFILFIIILTLTILQWNIRKRWVHYED